MFNAYTKELVVYFNNIKDLQVIYQAPSSIQVVSSTMSKLKDKLEACKWEVEADMERFIQAAEVAGHAKSA